MIRRGVDVDGAARRREAQLARAVALEGTTRIDASVCKEGLARTRTFAPIWGIVVGYLTFGILIPLTTVYTCAR